jgi:hypothetical protein
VSSEIIEHHDITGIEPTNQATAYEFNESRTVHCAFEGLMGEHTVNPDSSDHAEIFAPVGGFVIEHPLPARRSPIRRSHRDVATGLVDEDQVLEWDFRDGFPESVSLLADVRTKLLRRAEAFFFRVTPARCRARSRLERLSSPPYLSSQASRIASSVASGRSATSRTSLSNWSSAIRGGKPPPGASGSTLPRSRRRRSSRDTVASPTPKRCAKSKYVPSLRSYASTIRRLKSIDNTFTRPHRSDSLDLFKREAV